MEPTAADVLPKAIIKERVPAAGGTPAEVMAREMAKKREEGKSREALDLLSKEKPLNLQQINKKGEEIGTTRDNVTGLKARTPEEQARFDRYNQAAESVKNLLEKGYDHLDPDPTLNNVAQSELRGLVENAINANPSLSPEFNSLTPVQKEEMLKRILKDPLYAPKLKEVVGRLTNPEKKMLEEAEIADKTYEVTEKENKKKDADSALKSLGTELKAVNAKLQEFKRIGAVPTGAKAVEIERLQNLLPTLNSEIVSQKNKLRNAQTTLENLREERRYGTTRTTINDEIRDETKKIVDAQDEIGKKEDEIRTLATLKTEEEALKEEKTRIGTEQKNKEVTAKQADLEWTKAKRQLDDKVRVRVDQENDLVEGMKNATTEAANEYFKNEIGVLLAKFDTDLTESKGKTADENERAMIESVQKRWVKTEIKAGKKPKITISKAQVNTDWADVVGTGGTANLMKDLLINQRNPKTGVDYTPAEANAMLLDRADNSFYKKMEPTVLTSLFQNKILAGGLTSAEVAFVQRAPWGEGMMKKALDKNKQATAELEALTGEKAVNPGFMPKLWEQTKKKPWLLALLVGLVALPIMAAKDGISPIVK